MADQSPRVWWTSRPEFLGRVVWSHEFRNPERERLMRLAQAEMFRRRQKSREL
jgi:hypothetical protein